jgi:hypothetical protein
MLSVVVAIRRGKQQGGAEEQRLCTGATISLLGTGSGIL